MTELLNAEFVDETGTTRRLTREEILTYVTVIAGAGNETTTRLIGWAGKVLAEHPDQRRELVDDPALIPNAIEELLRFEPPAPHVARYVARDVEHYGQTVPEGSVMLFLVGSANRDDRRFPNGDRFDIHRDTAAAPHVRFRHPLLPRRRARPARGPRRARRGPEAIPGVGRRLVRRQALPDLDRARVGDAPGRDAVTVDEQARPRREVRQPGAAPARGRDARAHHHRGRRPPARLSRLELARADRRGVAERAGVNERTVYRYFAERTRAPRRGDGPPTRPKPTSCSRASRSKTSRTHTARILEYVSSFPLAVAHARRPDARRRAPAPARRARRRGVRARPTTGRTATARSPPRCSTCCGASRRTNASSSTGTSTRRTRSRAPPGSSDSSRTPSAPADRP